MPESTMVQTRWVVAFAAAALALGVTLGIGKSAHDHPSTSSGEGTALPAAEPERFLVPISTGAPSLGSPEALVTIVEWCDLRSEPCRAVDPIRHALLAKYEGRLRWTYRHYLEPGRSDANHVHVLAHAAHHVAGKFWEFRERIQKLPESHEFSLDELRLLVSDLGVDSTGLEHGLTSRGFERHVAGDMVFAGRYGVESGGPTFFVNGWRLKNVPREQIEPTLTRWIDKEIPNAEKLLAQEVERHRLYDKLVEDGKWTVDDDPALRKATQLAEGR